MSSNRAAKTTPTFNPEKPKTPTYYVDALIRVVQRMAPRASPSQWNRLGITARNIELSHEHFLEEVGRSSTSTTESVVPIDRETIRGLELRCFKIQDDIESLQRQLNAKKRELNEMIEELAFREDDVQGPSSR
ncbi:hypothetical protein L5515_007216 [Caenorhabditis briggsae]|uniref:Uncharacterized protein n=1 Tax=Caenorhabditis briggsae TaxID=6238 RepID=A0AAE9JJS6_CAEBR|nr:hypothetical protein L5515_007216 [Caenorhabditis briggsae]